MATSNKNITFKGERLTILGKELRQGDKLPVFTLTGQDMKDVSSESFRGKPLVIVTIPSLDTPVCSIESKKFNDQAKGLDGQANFVVISLDLPFAQKRWCGVEGINNLVAASDFKHRQIADAFGVGIKEWGLLARAVFVADASGTISHLEYVDDVSQEPDYQAVLKVLATLSS